MSIHAALHHRTAYAYDRPVHLSPQIIRLRPAPHARTHMLSYALKVSPEEGHFINWLQDPYGNFLARVFFPEPVTHFAVEVDLVAEMSVLNPFDFFLEDAAEQFPFEYPAALAHDLQPYLGKPVDVGPAFEKRLAAISRKAQPTVDFLVGLNQELEQEIDYLIRMEPGVQTPEETLSLAKGSCRDSAWLLVNLLRGLGLAARFVSGYLIQLKPDVKALDGPSGTEEDFTDLHAWAEVYLPGAGWIGFDATSGLLAGEGHIPLASAPEPLSAAPIQGSSEPCETDFSFDMTIRRIFESPRVTWPFSDEAWKRLDTLGQAIDARLDEDDVRLTMGGEPTFVSIDEPDAEEWNTAAVGQAKLDLSEALIRRLRDRFAPGALLHFGQGKWYPGESLPRWAYTCYWRDDGEALWEDAALMGTVQGEDEHGAEEAQRFLCGLAEKLQVDAGNLCPAYEDAWYYLWKEGRLPVDADPLDSDLKDAEERARLATVFGRGLDEPRGFVLPIQRLWQGKARRWESGVWAFRQKNLFLIPGDSPIGLRLPLETLPWLDEVDFPYAYGQDPSGPLPSMPSRAQYEAYRQRTLSRIEQQGGGRSEGDFGPSRQRLQAGETGTDSGIRTALCVEPRDGRLWVFLPPLRQSDDFIDLVSAIEATASELQLPVLLEGEAPPPDPRLKSFKITPDPGVIEVNIHPSANWSELVEKTETLYEEARQCRLGTEKFLLDGRHTGTGGGNHVVLGAATPLESPFLRRPDLLRSMLAYWQYHPSLSFLFSGLFIGPTSQSPRIDEARHDSLHELEIAFEQLEAGPSAQPWHVDRCLRHLLTDLTGNTHRAEFCIDKLYSPDHAAGRLGLLELRSFEMPPHARMSLAQQLLLRGLVSHFWRRPFKPRRLARWGTSLHDRWMLPYFLWADFEEVIADLREAGMSFEASWFASQFEFRFPRYGNLHCLGMELELRGALEPWHVLGEQGFSGNTVRFVDSSVERLQVRLRGFHGDRYRLCCNGRAVPMSPTGVEGEAVAGVRFRAWQPPSCLHPTVGVHAPLTFDLYDSWNGRSIGGCTYHVAHPAGRNYETRPINAYEAESRRLARFETMGHTAGNWDCTPEPELNPDFPLTLDLRRG